MLIDNGLRFRGAKKNFILISVGVVEERTVMEAILYGRKTRRLIVSLTSKIAIICDFSCIVCDFMRAAR